MFKTLKEKTFLLQNLTSFCPNFNFIENSFIRFLMFHIPRYYHIFYHIGFRQVSTRLSSHCANVGPERWQQLAIAEFTPTDRWLLSVRHQ